MSRSSVLTHIVRDDDGTSKGVWGPFVLKSAFQPIFAFHDGKLSVAAFEGLIRPFRNDVPVPPTSFFAALPAMDRFHVETLTRTLHLINAAACLPRETAIFVNFDPSVFIDRAIADAALSDMRITLNEVGIDPCRVVCRGDRAEVGVAGGLVRLRPGTAGQWPQDRSRRLWRGGFRHRPDQGAAPGDHQVRRALDHASDGVRAGLRPAVSHGRDIHGTRDHHCLRRHRGKLATRTCGEVRRFDGPGLCARPAEIAPTSFASFPTIAMPVSGVPARSNFVVAKPRPSVPPVRPAARTFGRKVVS